MKLTTTLLAVYAVAVSAQRGCNAGIQSTLARLGDYPPAQSLCHSRYPRTVTLTKRDQHSTMMTITTTKSHDAKKSKHTDTKTSKHNKPKPSKSLDVKVARDMESDTSDDFESDDSMHLQSEPKKNNRNKDSLYSTLLAQPSDNISTFCACNFAPKTVHEPKTKSKSTSHRARPTRSTTLTTTAETTSSTVTSTPSLTPTTATTSSSSMTTTEATSSSSITTTTETTSSSSVTTAENTSTTSSMTTAAAAIEVQGLRKQTGTTRRATSSPRL